MKCPQCGSKNVRTLEDEDLPQYYHCNDCGSEWT
jgi:transposase-like protein